MDIKTLFEAGKKADAQKAERRARDVKGSHLLGEMNRLVEESSLVTERKIAFLKVVGRRPGHKLLILLKGGRVDLSGYTIDHEAMKQISEEDAKRMHVGRVRGQIDFAKDDATVMDAFKTALAELTAQPTKTVPDQTKLPVLPDEDPDAGEGEGEDEVPDTSEEPSPVEEAAAV